MNLREWALSQGIHPQTAYRWYRQGKLPVPARKFGKLILVGHLKSPARQQHGRTAVYARVSSGDQKADLNRQVARVLSWATEHGYCVNQVITEVGSALNGHRRKFFTLLRDSTLTTILVKHRDRFCRFGAGYIEAVLQAQGRRLVVVDPSEIDDDLLCDATKLLTSLCARLYGQPSAANRAKRALQMACREVVA